jgi:hypothetical protein
MFRRTTARLRALDSSPHALSSRRLYIPAQAVTLANAELFGRPLEEPYEPFNGTMVMTRFPFWIAATVLFGPTLAFEAAAAEAPDFEQHVLVV